MPKMAAPRERSTLRFVTFLLSVVLLCGCAGPARWPFAADVAILVSDATPAYEQAANALRKRLDTAPRVFRLDNDQRKAEAARRAIMERGEIVVAIGAFAVRSTRGLTDREIIFCQVFHYEEPGLIADATRGVKATPPLLKQFQTWKQLDPRLKHIVLVTGPGLADLPAEARRAGSDAGVRVTHIEARSDKEMLYAVRNFKPPIQGLWLAPDHRILNSPALHDLLTYAVRQGIQVMVFNREFLDLGALLSAESDYEDVAERVYELVNGPRTKPGSTARVVPLRRTRVQVNAIVAKQFGLSVPPALVRGNYGL